MIRVLVADDQALVRSGLRLLLEDCDDIQVVAEAADGVEAVEAARRLRPDVSLVDIRMPRLDGLGVLRALAGPGVTSPLKVVVVTTFDHDEYVDEALSSGACGFVLKDVGPLLLVEAVRAAHHGEALISPSLTLRLLSRRPAATRGRGASAAALSPRELDVVRSVACGHTNAEVAAELFVAVSTVKSHLAAIQDRLGLRNRVEVAAWAWQHRLPGISVPGPDDR